MPLDASLKQKLDSLVASDSVVLFMKGTRSFPQCGFSASVVSILNSLVPKYTTVNILADNEIRTNMKEYSEWPTFPQLFINGEFVGGSDIVRQMHESGDLEKKLGSLVEAPKVPTVTVSARAAKELSTALAEGGPGDVIHITITPSWEHQLDLGPKEASHVTVVANNVTIQFDRASAARAEGLAVDFVEGPDGGGFKLDNPNRPAAVKAIGAKEMKALLDAGTVKHLYDVRTEKERGVAKIASSVLLDDSTMASIGELPKSTPIAFVCHHGNRSRAAAEHFLKEGFTTVYNVSGGIDAWSREVDTSIARY